MLRFVSDSTTINTKYALDVSDYDMFQAGDGTTSVVVLANEFLKEAKQYVEEGVHPQIIIKSYREASRLVNTICFSHIGSSSSS